MSKDAERERRLAEALRANLRKRKAQAREEGSDTPDQVRGDEDTQNVPPSPRP
jgi:hypothetical protein